MSRIELADGGRHLTADQTPIPGCARSREGVVAPTCVEHNAETRRDESSQKPARFFSTRDEIRSFVVCGARRRLR